MLESSTPAHVTVTTFTHDVTGRQLGAMWELETGAGKRWLAEVHDYNNGECGENGDAYDPITLGAFADPDQARAEIRDHVLRYSGVV